MHTIEQQINRTTIADRALRWLAVVSGVFSLIVAAFLVANQWRLSVSDPIHTPALKTLLAELGGRPGDAVLREQIRELDWLARRAFFSSQRFTQVASWLLASGLIITVLAWKSVASRRRWIPYPNPADPKELPADEGRWARQSLAAAALFMTGLALSVSLPWHDPLQPAAEDVPGAQSAPAGSSTRDPASSQVEFGHAAAAAERAKHWPSLRGAIGGRASLAHLPTNWNGKMGEGIAWKTKVPLPGFNSPIVWGDRIFCAGGSRDKRAVYSFDSASGRLLWECGVGSQKVAVDPKLKITDETGYAASSMTTDGVRVYGVFATGELAAMDFAGHLVWSRSLGTPEIAFGFASSLELCDGVLIVQMDLDKAGFVAGFDTHTGEPRWKTPRQQGPTWSSPAVIERAGRTELVLAGQPAVIGYDPANGRELWRVDCLKDGDLAATPVYAEGLLFVAADRSKLAAIEVQSRRIVWENLEDIPAVATPLAADDLLVVALAEGGIVCLEAKTGKVLWREETDQGFYASPLLIEKRVYLLDRAGSMHIFDLKREGYAAVARPGLGEEAVATPAVVKNGLILRGLNHLFRVGS